MEDTRTRAAVVAALGTANAQHDNHAWSVLNTLLDAMDGGLTESLADAVGEWDADQDEGEAVLPAYARPHDGRAST